MALVFVYGSLKRGCVNHARMYGARFVGTARVRGTLHDLGWFPGLERAGTGHVHGEVFQVDGEHLAALDEFEGVPNLYQRAQVILRSGLVVWTYVATRETLARGSVGVVENGCWTQREDTEDEHRGS